MGSLLYLSVATRTDITYAVNNVAKFCAHPTVKHWTAVKRIMRYLRGTTNFGIEYVCQSEKRCIGYSDSDWGGDIVDRKSTSGYVFQIAGGSISWRSKKQGMVALSTAEAEYVALASATQEALWLNQLLAEINYESSDEPMVIYEDNQSAIAMAKAPQFHGRTKHVSIKYHFIRDEMLKGSVDVIYCPTTDMVADALTKGLLKEQFVKLRQRMGLTRCSGE